jgi:hypothetical protein
MPHRAFRLADVSDRELLALLKDVADSDGTASTSEVAAVADLESEHPLTNVGVRLGYLRKIGMLERDEDMRWFLTTVGERFVGGKLTTAQRKALEALRDEGSAWQATEALSSLLGKASYTQATMMRRQWQHGWAQRNPNGR